MGVMTWFARLMLVLTSLAPILVVYAAVLFGSGDKQSGAVVFGLAAFLAILCLVLLKLAKGTQAVTRLVREPSERDGDALAFLVAYALPLATAKLKEAPEPLGLVAFGFMMTLLVWQQQIFHVNPLLGLWYHFFSAKADDGSRILVLSPKKTLAEGDLPVLKLSDYLWLHCP